MTKWEGATFVEIRMDAEIGSYQDDFERDREMPAFVVCEEVKEESDVHPTAR